ATHATRSGGVKLSSSDMLGLLPLPLAGEGWEGGCSSPLSGAKRSFLHVSQYWWLGTISESNEKGFPSVSTKYGMAELLPMRSSKYRQSISSAFWISARFI